jgi:energy-coupling factor transport system substrate-specific component
MDWIRRQFPTRVIVLIPVAIAINIVLGAIVQQYLKLPIYLDSIGTILVGVLAGPLPGLITGVLANIIWAVAPTPVQNPILGPFAITAAAIGLMAGLWGYLGVYRPRPASGGTLWSAAIAAVLIIAVLAWRIYTSPVYADPAMGFLPQVYAAIVIIAIIAGLAVGATVIIRRDASPAWVAAAGALTGIVAAIVSAPISAVVFEGVTGSGTDLLVAAMRQGGADLLNATLGQGLISDPLDKTITSFVVYVVLLGLSRRVIARFPLGERVVRPEPLPSDRPATAEQSS